MFFILLDFKSKINFSISLLFPLTTSWPLELSFAIKHSYLSLFSSMIFSTFSISDPNTATIPPSPLGTALCITLPLIFNILSVSEKLNALADAKAVYSPKECPAKKLALFKSMLNSFFKSWNIEYPTKKIAGCVFSVKSNLSLSPSKIKFDIEKPSISSASLKSFLTVSNFV